MNHRRLNELLRAVAYYRFRDTLLGKPAHAVQGERAKLQLAPVPVRAGPSVVYRGRVRVTRFE